MAMHDGTPNWAQSAIHVLNALERIEKNQEDQLAMLTELRDGHAELRTRVRVVEVRSSLWGSLAGALAGIFGGFFGPK